jgi:trimethylamine--corrinoid protein Co-methyltransferase
MNSGFKSRCVPNYRLLTEEQVQELHRATLEILETIGVRVAHPEAVEMLRAAGCRIKPDNIVLMPNWLVEESIRSAPSRITLYNRKGQEAMRLEGRNVYFGLGTDLIDTYDLKTGELRPSVLQDVVNATVVTDYCREIDFLASFALPHDVPTNTMYIECVRAMMLNSIKPIFTTAAGAEDLAYIIEMGEAVAGGREQLREKPFIIHYSEPTPPLFHSYGAVQKLFLCADRGVPITYVPGAMLGGSAPVTIAGGVAQANAEALSGIVLHQLRAKGAPIISGWAVVTMDMLDSTFSYGAPESRLTNSVFADLYHYYEIPTWSIVGTDAHAFDQQASMETAVAILMAALDGANLVHDIGYMGQGRLGHPAMLVMSNEIISYVKRIMRGFGLTREELALDVIRQVGPGGNYLAEEHTLKNFRQHLWKPHFMNRTDPEGWKVKGGKTYGEVVIRKTLQILETHQPEPLEAEVQEKINEIVRKAEKELKGKHFKA